MYACKYPVIILDEHQDASTAQHKAIMRIVESGSTKLRIFADRMQAIYGDEASSLVPWQTIEAASECRVELTIPQRWQKSGSSSGLGVWILEARNRLEHGYSLPSITPGCCVRFHPIDVEDFGFRPRIDGPVNKCLRSLLNRYKGSLAVVGWLKAQAYQLQIGGRGRLALNEGADFDEAQSALESFEKKAGKPQALALAVVKLFSKSKCGVTSARLNMIKAAIGRAELNLTGINEVGCLIEQLRPLYSTPDAGTACGVVRAILNSPPDWLTIRTPDCFSLLGQVSTADGVPCSEVLRQLIMQRKFRTSRRQRIASTIHKSKGLEFDHVIVTNFGATHFADTEDRRMLAYVAVSRACRTLDILVPARTPSPLLPSNLA
jgi:DNA helicase-2/ATP-dependent DNA helicase PcrA